VKPKYPGFGFDPEKHSHYFAVTFPLSTRNEETIRVVEHFEWNGEVPDDTKVSLDNRDLRILIKREQFKEVAEPVKAEFNRRLLSHGLPAGRWPARGGTALLSPSFGKELLLLLWAIEDTPLSDIQNAIHNWLGLSPEERWWLYTMTNAATGQAATGRNRGWRKAIRFALCENPISGPIIRKKAPVELSLFEDME